MPSESLTREAKALAALEALRSRLREAEDAGDEPRRRGLAQLLAEEEPKWTRRGGSRPWRRRFAAADGLRSSPTGSSKNSSWRVLLGAMGLTCCSEAGRGAGAVNAVETALSDGKLEELEGLEKLGWCWEG